jgi:hypothetical protein
MAPGDVVEPGLRTTDSPAGKSKLIHMSDGSPPGFLRRTVRDVMIRAVWACDSRGCGNFARGSLERIQRSGVLAALVQRG